MSEKYFRGTYQIQVALPWFAIMSDYNSPWESVAMLADMGIALWRVDMFLPSVIVWWAGTGRVFWCARSSQHRQH
jgi:hypothetical protein